MSGSPTLRLGHKLGGGGCRSLPRLAEGGRSRLVHPAGAPAFARTVLPHEL